MNIGNRDKLTRNDIQNTLVLNGLEKLYGYSSKDLKMKDIKFSNNEILSAYKNDYIDLENEFQSVPEYGLKNTFRMKWIAFDNKLMDDNNQDSENDSSITKRNIGENELIYCLINNFIPMSLNFIRNGGEQFEYCIIRIENDYHLQKFIEQYLDFIQDKLTYYQGNLELMYRITKLISTLLKNKNLNFTKYIDDLVSYIFTLLFIPSTSSMSYNLEIREEACISIKLICDRFNDLKAQIADELYNVIINNLADEYGIYGAIKAFHYLGKQILEIKFIPYIENDIQ